MTPETIEKLKLLANNMEEFVGLIMTRMVNDATTLDGHKMSKIYSYSQSWGEPEYREQMSHCKNQCCLYEITLQYMRDGDKENIYILSGSIAVKCPL
jgi:hypothetical protein